MTETSERLTQPSGNGTIVTQPSQLIIPTTEELLDMEKDIHRLIDAKRRADLLLIDLEARIHAVETEYFRETSQFGSILLNGLEGYLGTLNNVTGMGSTATNAAATVGINQHYRKYNMKEIKETDRLFSNTSGSHQRALAVHAKLIREEQLEPFLIRVEGSNSNPLPELGIDGYASVSRGRSPERQKLLSLSNADKKSTRKRKRSPTNIPRN